MIKMPPHIKKAIRTGAKHYAKAIEQNELVRDWLDSIGQGENDAIIDQLIDGMENSYDPEGAIKGMQVWLDEEEAQS